MDKVLLDQYHGLSIHWSSDCNMACTYCYIEKYKCEMSNYNKSIRDSLKNGTFVQQIKQVFKDNPNNIENLGLWGAEPTINGDLFPAFITELLDFFPNLSAINFSTNALLGQRYLFNSFLMPMYNYSKEHQRNLSFELQFSLDGPAYINDASRHPGATANTIKVMKDIASQYDGENPYFHLEIHTKPTLDISFMKSMVERGLPAFQEYFDFADQLQYELCEIAKDKKNFMIRAFTIPTLVDPGYYTQEQGKIFAEWISYLSKVDRTNWKSNYHGALFFQTLSMMEQVFTKKLDPIKDGYNVFSCSAGKNNITVDHEGHIYTCNRLCRNAALGDEDRYKYVMINNSNIDGANEKTMVKRDYAWQMFHESIEARRALFDGLVSAMAVAGQIDREFLDNSDLRTLMFYAMCGLYCHIGVEEDYTGNPFICCASYVRLLGNGAISALLDYIKFEKGQGRL